MTQAFEKAFSFTHAEEGGFVLSTLQDETAQTYAGIYRKYQPNWDGWELIDAGDTGSDELKRRVKVFFFSRFWVRPGLEQLPAPLNALVFDFSVNSGTVLAIKKLQHLLPTGEDGIIGANTTALCRAMPNDKLNMRYIASRLDYLNNLANWKINSGGWSQRIANILNYAAQ